MSGNDLCEYFTNNSFFSSPSDSLVCRLYPTTAPSRSAKDVGKCCPFFPSGTDSVPGGAEPMDKNMGLNFVVQKNKEKRTNNKFMELDDIENSAVIFNPPEKQKKNLSLIILCRNWGKKGKNKRRN
jgi:hypothetical protein